MKESVSGQVHDQARPATSELVREALCLAQGLDGKFISFHPNEPFQCTVACKSNALEPSLAALLKRVAIVGDLYRVVSSFSEEFRTTPDDLIRQNFGKALNDQLDVHCKLIIDLHRKECPALLQLHATLMGRPLALFKYLRFVCLKVKHKHRIELLDELYELFTHGNEHIQCATEAIFVSTLMPLLGTIRDMLLQKESVTHVDQVSMKSSNQFEKDSIRTSIDLKFLSNESQKLVLKLGLLLKSYLSVISKSKIQLIKSQINSLFSMPVTDGTQLKIKFNLHLESRLKVIYPGVNAYIRSELLQSQVLQNIMVQIDRFFWSLHNSIEEIGRLEPNQLNILTNLQKTKSESNWDHVRQEVSRLDNIVNYSRFDSARNHNILVPIYFQDDQISMTLVDGKCRLTYFDIFMMLYHFKTNRKALLDCWKKIRNLSVDARNKWTDGIPEVLHSIFYRMSLKANQMVWAMWMNENKMHSAVIEHIEHFRRQFFTHAEILNLRKLHRQFLDAIHKEIQTAIQTQLEDIIGKVPEFCNKVNSFIDVTKTFYPKSEIGWHHDQEKNMQIYKEQLDKLGIVEFIGSIYIEM